MRPGRRAPRPVGKAAANGSSGAAAGWPAKALPRRLGASPAAPRCSPQAARHRYPLPQAASPLALCVPRWEGYSPRSVPWSRRARPVRSTLRIPLPVAGPARSPALEQLISPVAFPTNSSPDPCAKETVLNAIRESRKRAVEQEEEEDDQAFENNQESKRRRHDSSGSGQSAFEPLVTNGVPASLIPKPGPLKRGLVSHCPDDCSNKRSRTSSMSSLSNTYPSGIPSSSRNAIASSYSSSGGIAQLWKRSGVSVSTLSSPASSRPQTPEWPLKKAREEELQRSNTSTPVKSDKELQTEKGAGPDSSPSAVVETVVWRKQNSLSPPSSLGNGGKRKRKIQLLSPGERLVLPLPPQLGYCVTSEDLDAEKRRAMQWINKVLEDKADVVPSTTAETTAVSRPLVFTVSSSGPVPASATPALTSTNSLLDSLKKMQNSQAVPVPEDSAEAAVTSQPPPSAAQPDSSPLPATSADTKPVPALSAAPSAPLALGVQPPSSLAPPAFTELGQTPSKPPSFPKPSILFGTLSTPPASQPATTTAAPVPITASPVPVTAAVPTTSPVFKPIFGVLPKSESAVPCPAVGSSTASVAVSSAASSTSSSATVFKPIFGSVTAASSPAKASPFAFKPASPPAAAPDAPAASTTGPAGLAALPNVIFTTAASAATTQGSSSAATTQGSSSAATTHGSSTDATVKPVFSFGLNPPASTGPTASLTVTATTSQPFLFGSPATSAPSTETSFATPGPVFQFGKPPPATGTATTSVPGGPAFGQAPSNSTAPTTTTTAGFSIFGGTTLTTSSTTTTTQAPLTFGSSISAFGSSFSAKPPPPYPSAGPQPPFSAGAAESPLPAPKPAAGPSAFGSPFSFGASPAQTAAQPAFGSGAAPAFGTASTQGSFGTSSAQAAFGTAVPVFSFGTVTSTTASFASTTQTTSSTTIFGTTPSPFPFGASAQPGPSASAFGIAAATPSSGSPAATFSFGSGQGAATPGPAAPFGSSLPQSAPAAQSQSTPFAFTAPGSKPVFGGSPAPAFGQSTPVLGAAGSGSSGLSFGMPSTPASAFGGAGTSFGSSTPTFSIGSGYKTCARQRLQARRQHTRKK
ncbi:nuclear envelope pore membrane protein POM 121 isoform X2 [Colius striatus]|uniref:nuclear envelope pore membrane protein POM 121 isoform X2 n=1 Tax=Colius striatus TaxID=57412 RepID=UPI002B1DED9B|nr:nuclear envelope pore membrane protein POM 121 isoform X2 [Colius striatus]